MEVWANSEVIAKWLLMFLVVIVVIVFLLVVLTRKGMERIVEAKEQQHRMKLEHQQTLLSNSILIQERERERIAADIHDELIGKLTKLQLMIGMEFPVARTSSFLQDSIDQARRISHDLTPPLIAQTELQALITDCCDPFRQLFAVHYNWQVESDVELSAEIKIQLVRILQEWMNNIRKHAACTAVAINLRLNDRELHLSIQDNGKGFDRNSITPGLGLKNIEGRTTVLNGVMHLKTAPGNGTELVLTLSLNPIP